MNRAPVTFLLLAVSAGCFGTPRTTWPDADFSTGGHGGTSGAGAGGSGGLGGSSIGGGTGGIGGAAGAAGIGGSGGCANLSNDSSNCGACGHSCLGGMCSSGTCLPVTLANLPATTLPVGLAVNSYTVFTTVPGDGVSAWSLYGVPKTAVNASPSPILTAAVGNNRTGFLGGNDTVLFAETGYNNSPGGNASTVISCDPTNCASTQQNWYTSSDSVSACDPSPRECFVAVSSGNFSTFRYAKQGAASQTSPQSFSPVLSMASGIRPAATGSYLYMAGVYGLNPSQTYAVLQRVSQDGISGVSTLANLGLSTQYVLDGPLVVTSTRVYVVGTNIEANTTGLISISVPNGVGNTAPPFLAGTTMSSDNWIAAWGDDTAVYFGNAARQWVTCPASGCPATPTVLSDASSASPYLVGDAQAIYWINTTSDPTKGRTTGFSLMKVAR